MIFYSFEINNKQKFQSLRQIPKTVNIYDFSDLPICGHCLVFDAFIELLNTENNV